MPRFTNGHKKICNKHDSCRLVTPKWFEKILKYDPGEKLLKVPFAIFLDLGCLLKNEQSCEKNPVKSCTVKKAKHDPSDWTMFTKCSFDKIENRLDYYRRKDCIETLCKKLKEHAMKIINYVEKDEENLLTDEENRYYEEQEACNVCTEKFRTNENDENYKNHRLKITVITSGNLEELLIVFPI